MSELYQLPDGWAWRTVDDVLLDIKTGTTPPKNEQKYYDMPTIDWLSPSDFGECKELLNSKNKINEIALVDKKAKIYPPNSLLLVAIGATIGKVGISRQSVSSNQQITGLKFKDSVDIDFSYYWFVRIKQTVINTASTATLPIINQNGIKQLPFPQPSLAEQKRIVQKLDALFERIDKAIALLQKNIDAADNFMNSVLNEVFSDLEQNYNKHSVDELCTKITDGTHSTPCYTDSGVPFLSVKDISNGVINFSNTRFISLEEHKLLSKRCNVEKNDLLYTKVGTTGIAKVVDVENEFSIFVSVALLKPKHDIIYNKFFQYMLNSPNCYSQAQKLTRGVANRNLVLKDIRGIIFPVPPYQMQQKIVAYLDEVSTQIEQVKLAQQQKMQNLLDLKSSILDQAFHGKL